jgi:hypothetical protein
MAALTAQRTVPGPRTFKTMDGLAAANVRIYAGAIIACVNGYWQPVTVAVGLAGKYAIAMEECDNTGGAAGARTVKVQFPEPKTLYLLRNDATAPILQAHIGGSAFALDDQTVSADSSSNARSRLGTPWAFFEQNMVTYSDRLWVDIQ